MSKINFLNVFSALQSVLCNCRFHIQILSQPADLEQCLRSTVGLICRCEIVDIDSRVGISASSGYWYFPRIQVSIIFAYLLLSCMKTVNKILHFLRQAFRIHCALHSQHIRVWTVLNGSMWLVQCTAMNIDRDDA